METYYTAKLLAERWNVSERYINQLRMKDAIPYFRLPHGRHYRYPVADIQALEVATTFNLEGGAKRKTAPTAKKKWKVKL